MSKHAVFTMKLEPELREAFLAEAEAVGRPASQVVRELMREYIARQRQAREYDAYLQQRVDTARVSDHERHGRDNEYVEAQFAARRDKVDDKA